MLHNPHRFVLLDSTNEDTPVPASGGAAPAASSPGSDVNWEEESAPEGEHVEAAPKGEAKPAATPAPAAAPAGGAAAAAPAAPAAPSAPAVPAPAPAVPAPAAVQPQPPATPAPAVAAPAAPVAPAAPAPARPSLQELRAQEVTRLTQGYALSEEMARGLLVEPEKHLPALLAKVQLDTTDAVIGAVYADLPRMIQTLTQASRGAAEAEQAFFGQWPQLHKPEYKATVENAIKTYRSLNKDAKRDEVIRAAGLAAMITLRLPIPQEMFAQPPAAPAAPAGHVPAAPGASVPVAPAPQPGNAFQLLNAEFDAEER